ncbi:hypothetical protein C8J55DRAFT_490981 [Lentinula edodes]|uniref:Uncharacterized protein n=1 Tax=Lentinula lateritia TaxID=40482 RepID=A0A9W9A3C3_9AGAR|nr:hypothetical protein C8J55DRAFT_490981 [Lentinula edodes]
MSPLIQQKFHLKADPACIPTFDHGLLQQVYAELPRDRYGQQIPLKQFWRLRKPGGLKWEYYCPCTSLANTPGIPARCYEVKKQGSCYFGHVYLGCGKTRQCCQWKVHLDLVFSAAAAACHPVSSEELEFRDPEEFDESFNEEFAQLMDELHIRDKGSALQAITREAPGSEVGKDFAKLFGSLDLSDDERAFLQASITTSPQLTEEEVAQILSGLTLNESGSSSVQANPATMVWNEEDGEWQLSMAVYEELVAFFAGQDNVHVSMDGAIHFNPMWATAESASNDEVMAVTLHDNNDNGTGDTTLVETSPLDLGNDAIIDLTVAEGPFYSKVQHMYVDLTMEDFPRQEKCKQSIVWSERRATKRSGEIAVRRDNNIGSSGGVIPGGDREASHYGAPMAAFPESRWRLHSKYAVVDGFEWGQSGVVQNSGQQERCWDSTLTIT